ncbi:MAG: cytochrome c oxidase assembly protein, partial [Sphingopyxis sp.]|nr:cytochrome c oxidase assembly protein [Sphingopyxis sp.]
MNPNLKVAMLAAGGVAFMTGLGFASVPLYQLFCQVTGLNGTTQRGSAAPGATGRQITIAFDSNVGRNLPWRFSPEARSDTIAVGARDMAFYTA